MTETETRAAVELGQFGYRQEFKRSFRAFASFAIPMSFISITTGTFTTYGTVLRSSGPVGIWTWLPVAVGVLMVALVFATLSSRIPLAGYSYQWMSRLANPHIGWILGWFVFAFLIVDVVAVDYALASTVAPALFSYTGTMYNTWLATALIVLAQGLLVLYSTRWTQRVNNVAAAGTEIIGIGILTILLFVVGTIRGRLHWGHIVSFGAVPHAGYFTFGSGSVDSPWVLAFLLGAFTIVGFEAAGNLAEETHNPGKIVPRAMWTSVALSGALGFIWLIAVTAGSSNLKALSASSTPIADIMYYVLGTVIGRIFLIVVLFSIFACGLVILVTATRVCWAMSRDQRFPGWKGLRIVSQRTDSPLWATVTVGVVIEIVLAIFATQSHALLHLFSAATLMPAVIYVVTVILYVYAIARKRLPATHGFSLGKWEIPVIVVSLAWLAFELSIFRASTFTTPWEYAGIMTLIGLVYFVYMVVTRRSLAMPRGEGASGAADSTLAAVPVPTSEER